jgi:predicted amidophosphoribosyltransferase
MVKIDHWGARDPSILVAMSSKNEQALTVRCPTCGAKVGEKCELSTGLLRTEPHRDRRLASAEKRPPLGRLLIPSPR